MSDAVEKIEKIEKILIQSKKQLGSLLMTVGFFMVSVPLLSFAFRTFNKKNLINRFIDLKRLYYNRNVKTFYISDTVTGNLVDEFKQFMINVGPKDEIDIVLETYGGFFSGAQMISDMILSHEGVTNAIVLNRAFSAGTLIALSCTNLYMHKNAHLSPVDVLQSDFFKTIQLSAVQTIIDNKTKDKINDDTFIMADQAEKSKNLLNSLFERIIKPKYSDDVASIIKQELFDGNKYIHSTSFSSTELKNIGLKINDILPNMIKKAQCVYPPKPDYWGR